MNQVNNQNAKKKDDEKPTNPLVNPVFAKPMHKFFQHFAASKKPSLSQLSKQTYQPHYKYATPMVDRRSVQGTTSTSTAVGSNDSSRKVSFDGGNHREGTSSSSNFSRPQISSPLTSIENLSSSKPTTSSFKTPISARDVTSVGTSSSRTKRTRTSGTPRSTSSATTSTANQSRVIVAITEGRGSACGEVGLAAMDVRRPCLIMCQFSDTHSYHNTVAKLNVLNPSVLLFPNTIVDNQKSSKLHQTIQKKFPTVTQESVHRKFYNDQEGMDSVKSLHLPECSSIELLVVRKYFTLAAAAALVKYVEFIEHVNLASGSVPMEYQSLDEIMMIDFDTMIHLELTISHSSGTEARSLCGVLNRCFTSGGKQRLRSAILQPSVIKDDLNARLDCVTELAQDMELRQNIQNALAKIPDIESLLKICFIPINMKPDDTSISMMNYIILLKTTLDVIPDLYSILVSATTEHFKKITKCLTDSRLKDMASEIDELLVKDAKRWNSYAASQFQRCFAIKPNINGLLDVARAAYSELISQFTTKVAELGEKYELTLKCQNTSTKGHHITLDIKGKRDFRMDSLPQEFIKAQKSKNVVTMTTEELIILNERITQALQEVQLMNNAILQVLLQKIREKTGCLYHLCDSIAELDVIVSLSRVSSNSGYVRPVFGSKLALKSARHPILDFTSSSVPIENDVMATDRYNFHIITGPNMGGKSIYIKQIALVQIMAQIGCYVPAVAAEVKLMDHLFTRISFDDNIECSSSHFTVELKEMEHILRNKTESSLVIIDEFCRGTATDEGTAIAWATCEEFIDTTVYVFFATHFHFLAKLQDFYASVKCWFFDAEIITPEGDERPRLHFNHRLLPGVVSIEHYGLKLAESTALPQHMKEAANQLAENLSKAKQQTVEWHLSEQAKNEAAAERLVFELLDMADKGRFSVEALRAALETINLDEIVKAQSQGSCQEQNMDSQNSNAEAMNLQESEDSDSHVDIESTSGATQVDRDISILEPVLNSAARSNALESLKQYCSFNSDSGSEGENTLIGNFYVSKKNKFSAEDDTSEEETAENFDVTSRTMTSFCSTPKNLSSTPINSLNWNSGCQNGTTEPILAPETVSVRGNALENVQCYDSFDSNSGSAQKNAPKKWISKYYRSDTEESITQSAAEDDRENHDAISKTDSFYRSFKPDTPQNHSSTPINSMNWTSDCFVSSKPQKSSQTVNDTADLSLHSQMKRARKTDHVQPSPLISLHCSETLRISPQTTAASTEEGFSNISAYKKEVKTKSELTKLCESPASTISPVRRTGGSEWHTSASSIDQSPARTATKHKMQQRIAGPDNKTGSSISENYQPIDYRDEKTNEQRQCGGIERFELNNSSSAAGASPSILQPILKEISWGTPNLAHDQSSSCNSPLLGIAAHSSYQINASQSSLHPEFEINSPLNCQNPNISLRASLSDSFAFKKSINDLRGVDQKTNCDFNKHVFASSETTESLAQEESFSQTSRRRFFDFNKAMNYQHGSDPNNSHTKGCGSSETAESPALEQNIYFRKARRNRNNLFRILIESPSNSSNLQGENNSEHQNLIKTDQRSDDDTSFLNFRKNATDNCDHVNEDSFILSQESERIFGIKK